MDKNLKYHAKSLPLHEIEQRLIRISQELFDPPNIPTEGYWAKRDSLNQEFRLYVEEIERRKVESGERKAEMNLMSYIISDKDRVKFLGIGKDGFVEAVDNIEFASQFDSEEEAQNFFDINGARIGENPLLLEFKGGVKISYCPIQFSSEKDTDKHTIQEGYIVKATENLGYKRVPCYVYKADDWNWITYSLKYADIYETIEEAKEAVVHNYAAEDIDEVEFIPARRETFILGD